MKGKEKKAVSRVRKSSLFARVVALIEEARQKVATVANIAQVYANFEIGRQIVEELLQRGVDVLQPVEHVHEHGFVSHLPEGPADQRAAGDGDVALHAQPAAEYHYFHRCFPPFTYLYRFYFNTRMLKLRCVLPPKHI